MATAPSTGMSAGAAAGIGAIGNAINAYQDRKGQQAMQGMQTQQLKDQIAFQRKVMEQQAVLRQEEVARQQMMAQAAGQAFADSKGLFQNVEGDIGSKANNISDVFRAALARQTPQSTAPMGTGPTSGYEAAMRAEQSADVGREANRLAAVQAFGQTMTDKNYAMNENDQFASLLRNFGAGSQQASQAEIQARAGQLYQPRITAPAPSDMGDLFVGLASAYANRQPAGPSPYALNAPAGSQQGFRATGSQGIRTDRPAGLGIR